MNYTLIQQQINQINYANNMMIAVLQGPEWQGLEYTSVQGHVIRFSDFKTQLGIVKEATRFLGEELNRSITSIPPPLDRQLPTSVPQQVVKGVDAFDALDVMTKKFRSMSQGSRESIIIMLNNLRQDIDGERMHNTRRPGTSY